MYAWELPHEFSRRPAAPTAYTNKLGCTLTVDAMLRNLDRAPKLGCLTPGGPGRNAPRPRASLSINLYRSSINFSQKNRPLPSQMSHPSCHDARMKSRLPTKRRWWMHDHLYDPNHKAPAGPLLASRGASPARGAGDPGQGLLLNASPETPTLHPCP
jgi:hypothetical protein